MQSGGSILQLETDFITIGSERFFTNRDSLLDIILLTEKRNKMVEVGSLAGFSTRLFSLYFDSVISVDPYKPGYDEEDINSQEKRLMLARDLFLLRFMDDPKVSQLQIPSTEAAHRFEDHSIDFVYLDAGHNYQAVKTDIETWLPKVRSGGFIAGDDYKWPGVKEAVSELLPEHKTVKGRWIKNI